MNMIYNDIKRILFTILCICCLFYVQAQESTQTEARNEIAISLGGGMSTLYTNDPLGVQQQAGLGGNFGLTYTYFISPRIGIGTGIEIAYYQSKYSANQISGDASGTDPLNPNYMYSLRYTYQNFKEHLSNSQFQIPIFIQYQSSSWPRFYMQAGARFGYHLNANSNITADRLTMTGNFEYEGQAYHDIGYGFEPLLNINQEQDLKFKAPDCKLSFEIGTKWKMKKNNAFYGGLYVDYGISKLLQSPLKIPGIVDIEDSEYIADDMVVNTASISNLNTIAIGIKLRYAFGSGSISASQRQTTSPSAKKMQQTTVKTHANSSTYTRTNEAFNNQNASEQANITPIIVNSESAPLVAQTTTEETTLPVTVQETIAETPIIPVQTDSYHYASTDSPALPVFDQGIVPESELQHVSLSIRERAMAILAEPIDNYSDIAESDLTPEMQKMIDRKIVILKNEPSIILVLCGHTCNVKSDAINNEIGIQRANEIKYYMVRQGINPTRITTTSTGAKEPVATNNTEEGRRLNRRVTFTPIYSVSIQYPTN